MTPIRRLRNPLISAMLCIALNGTSVLQVAQAAQGTYIVQPNDTLSGIAQRFGTTTDALASANNLANPDQIYVGETLTLDSSAGSAGSSTTYIVQAGDTLSSISRQFGVSLSSLASVNSLVDPSTILVGQQLTVPSVGGGSSSSYTPAAQITQSVSSSYVVQPGDTLSGISQQYGVTLDSLLAANNLSLQSILTVGQQLSIPSAGAATISGVAAAAGVETPVDQGTIGQILTAQALAAGVDPALVKAVAWQESGWQMVTASDGGMGVMQLMPDAVTWVSTSLLGYQINPYDPTDNIRAGVAMLRYFLLKYGDVTDALAAYHQGMGSLQTDGILPETQGYINNILALQQQF